MVAFLNERKIGTRNLFGGNLLRQPAYAGLNARQIGLLPNSNKVLADTFWIGVWPGIDDARLSYMLENLREFMKKWAR